MRHLKFKNLNIVYTEAKDGNQKDPEIRKEILKIYGFDKVFIPNQKHTNRVLDFFDSETEADGIFVKEKGKPAGVLTADCLPVVITDFNSFSVVHAGWRGLVNGIIENALGFFDRKKDIFAFIGPSAGKCCYEVQEDFMESMLKKGIDKKYFYQDGKIRFSLKELAEDKLKRYGIKEVFDISLCNICSDKFFSYRKGDFDKRILTFAWLED
ncbi:polyphenol oxidase family protein [Persephonella sp.]|uniref:polyphenol oxidase family protein n=1 Tax=Persephonella sp. TaxID=2060922 RepID=UPI002600CA99|nr:polyphenol oxidase family protein [Persephonella sp.]